MKLHKQICTFIVIVFVCVCLIACSNDDAGNEVNPATTGDATACEYVTSENTLDIERLMKGVESVSVSGIGVHFEATVDECDELLSALAEIPLVMKIIPQPTPTPAPGHLLSISLRNEQSDGYFHISLKTDGELWLSEYVYEKVYSGRSDEYIVPHSERTRELERWNFIIESEDGQRIHEIARGIYENAD